MLFMAVSFTFGILTVEVVRNILKTLEVRRAAKSAKVKEKEKSDMELSLALFKLQNEVNGIKEVIGYAKAMEQMKDGNPDSTE